MQKSNKLTAVYALIMDLPLSLVITLVALALSNIDAPGSLNGPNYIRMAIIAYVVTFFVNFLHAERWGFAFASKHAKPGTFKFGLLLNLVVAGVFVVILDLIMTAVGMAASPAGFQFGPYIAAVLKGFIPCYVPTLIIAMFWNGVADKLSRAICNEPAPQMGPGPDQK
ncbi:MAG: hypothetical protein IJH92_05035 [Mogibacterium sp.]|nr:hypothetical protein [Mogibacterium sp.]